MSTRQFNAFRKKSSILMVCVFLWVALSGASPVIAQDDEISLLAKVGYDGFCKQDSWLPVRVEVQNAGDDLDATIEVAYKKGEGRSATRMSLELPSGSRKEVFLYSYFSETFTSQLTVRVLDGNKVLKEVKQPLSCLGAGAMLFGVLSDQPAVFDSLNDVKPMTGFVRVAQLSVAELPEQPQAWEMLDALVISNVDTGLMTAAQKQALQSWTAAGGTVLVAGGLNWQSTTAGLKDIMPFEISGTRRVSSLSALESYVHVQAPLDAEAVLLNGRVFSDAQVLLFQNGAPLLIKRSFGFGSIYVLTADPALQPLRDWVGMKDVYEHLLATRVTPVPWADGITYGYQASRALASIPELGLPPMLYIWCLLGAYILIIGPINYFVLKGVKKRELGWFTIPVLVIVFTSLAYGTGYFYRGVTPILNRLVVMQAWDGVEQARVDAMIGIYSPVRKRYDLQSTQDFFVQPFMDEGDVQSNNEWLVEQNGSDMILPDVRGEIASMKSVAVVGSLPALDVKHTLVLTLGNGNPHLSGTVTNNSKHTLRDAVIATAGAWRQLGDLEPGATKKVNITLLSNVTGSNFFSTDAMNILGIDYSDISSDADAARRYAFLDLLLRSEYGFSYGNAGFYLIGWIDDMELPVHLQNQNAKTIDTIIYVDQLTPGVQTKPEDVRLPISLLSWESSAAGSTPFYSSNVPAGGYSLRFQPVIPVQFRTVKTLQLNLQTNASYSDLVVSAWDYDLKNWVRLQITSSQYNIPEPERFVGPDGEVRLQVRNTGSGWTEIQTSFITMVVEP